MNVIYTFFRSLKPPVKQILLHLSLFSVASLQSVFISMTLTSLITQSPYSIRSIFSNESFSIAAFIIVPFFRQACPAHANLLIISLVKHGLQNKCWSFSLCRFLHSPICEPLYRSYFSLSIFLSKTQSQLFCLYYSPNFGTIQDDRSN